ncbi:hypothetical protein M513_00428, partial [Trichuris suis]
AKLPKRKSGDRPSERSDVIAYATSETSVDMAALEGGTNAKRRNISGRHGSGKDLQHAVAYCSEQWSSMGTPHLFHSSVRAGSGWLLSCCPADFKAL